MVDAIVAVADPIVDGLTFVVDGPKSVVGIFEEVAAVPAYFIVELYYNEGA